MHLLPWPHPSLDPRWKLRPQNVFISKQTYCYQLGIKFIVGTLSYAPALHSMPTDMKPSENRSQTRAHIDFKLCQFRGLKVAIALIPKHFFVTPESNPESTRGHCSLLQFLAITHLPFVHRDLSVLSLS